MFHISIHIPNNLFISILCILKINQRYIITLKSRRFTIDKPSCIPDAFVIIRSLVCQTSLCLANQQTGKNKMLDKYLIKIKKGCIYKVGVAFFKARSRKRQIGGERWQVQRKKWKRNEMLINKILFSILLTKRKFAVGR